MERHLTHLLSELALAIANGFIHQFRLCPSGYLHLLGTDTIYMDVEKGAVLLASCFECGWTIYLITTPDGNKGTLVDFHSDHSPNF